MYRDRWCADVHPWVSRTQRDEIEFHKVRVLLGFSLGVRTTRGYRQILWVRFWVGHCCSFLESALVPAPTVPGFATARDGPVREKKNLGPPVFKSRRVPATLPLPPVRETPVAESP